MLWESRRQCRPVGHLEIGKVKAGGNCAATEGIFITGKGAGCKPCSLRYDMHRSGIRAVLAKYEALRFAGRVYADNFQIPAVIVMP